VGRLVPMVSISRFNGEVEVTISVDRILKHVSEVYGGKWKVTQIRIDFTAYREIIVKMRKVGNSGT